VVSRADRIKESQSASKAQQRHRHPVRQRGRLERQETCITSDSCPKELLRPLPYSFSERLRAVSRADIGGRASVSFCFRPKATISVSDCPRQCAPLYTRPQPRHCTLLLASFKILRRLPLDLSDHCHTVHTRSGYKTSLPPQPTHDGQQWQPSFRGEEARG
jgi:hypothetical protein